MKSRKQGSLYFSDMHLKAYGGSSMSEDCREEGLQPIARFPNPHPFPVLSMPSLKSAAKLALCFL